MKLSCHSAYLLCMDSGGSSLSITEIGHGSNLSTQKVEVRELEVHDHLQQLHSYLNVSLGQIRP